MELLDMARILLRRWWLVLIPVAVVGAVVGYDLLNRAPASTAFNVAISYSAAQSLEAIPRMEGDYQDIWRASELTVNAFTEWVLGSAFASEVAAQTSAQGLDIDPAALRIAADNESSIGQIVVTWANPDQLQVIAEAVITILQTRSQAYFAQLGDQPAQVTILHRSAISPAAPPLTDRFGPFIRLGLGLLAGIGLALLAHYLDPAIRRPQDVEAVGLVVIGSIPPP